MQVKVSKSDNKETKEAIIQQQSVPMTQDHLVISVILFRISLAEPQNVPWKFSFSDNLDGKSALWRFNLTQYVHSF